VKSLVDEFGADAIIKASGRSLSTDMLLSAINNEPPRYGSNVNVRHVPMIWQALNDAENLLRAKRNKGVNTVAKRRVQSRSATLAKNDAEFAKLRERIREVYWRNVLVAMGSNDTQNANAKMLRGFIAGGRLSPASLKRVQSAVREVENAHASFCVVRCLTDKNGRPIKPVKRQFALAKIKNAANRKILRQANSLQRSKSMRQRRKAA
jgi:hypothetical protein